MNKTVNINLAGVFFHIDEDAYAKLQHYLEAIKTSLATTQGRDEIMTDIEARIAELFSEKIRNERQVISVREVDEIILVMGQPEDYMVDEEIFEDEPVPGSRPRSTGKKLYRDTDNSYIGGVSSGLGHYLGIHPNWLRLAWILLTIFSTGAFLLIYIALWIFIPEAKTTADKLAMRGEPVTISNIEKRIREGFDEVSGKMKNINYEKYGYKAKSGAGSAATAAGDVVMFILNIFVKLVGILILLIAGTALIGLFIGLFSIGTFGIIDAPWTDYVEMTSFSTTDIWVISLLTFFAVGIPFFFLFILGLKILVSKLKSIGRTAKLVLLGVWIISIFGLVFFGIKQATERAFDGEVVKTEPLPVRSNDTLYLSMRGNPNFQSYPRRRGNFQLRYDENDQKVLFSSDIRLIVRSTNDSVGRMEITRSAEGKSSEDARRRAAAINYNTSFSENELILNGYLTTNMEQGDRDQEVQVLLYLPVGTVLYAADNTYSYHRNSSYYDDILKNGDEEKYLKITQGETQCLNCPEEEDPWNADEGNDEWENNESESERPREDLEETDSFKARVDVNGSEVNIRVNNKSKEN